MINEHTLKAVQAESARAHAKHGERSLLGDALTTTERLAALIEEVGEVARLLTYDNAQGRDELVKELLQVASVAASWAEWLDESDRTGPSEEIRAQLAAMSQRCRDRAAAEHVRTHLLAKPRRPVTESE